MFLFDYQLAIAIICSFLLGVVFVWFAYLLYLFFKDKRLQKQKLINRISSLEERLRDFDKCSYIQYNFLYEKITKLNKKVFKDEKTKE